jgi:glycine oxidase
VIGAGVVGCAAGLALARRGARVVVLERGSAAGAEASSAAGGIVGSYDPHGDSDAPPWLGPLSLRSRGLYPSLCEHVRAATGVDPDFVPCGALRVGDEPPALAPPAEWLSPPDLAKQEPALAPGLGASLHPEVARVDPAALVRGLAGALVEAGGELRAKAEVVGLSRDGGRVRGVALASGERVVADATVLASGAWSPQLGPTLRVEPVRGQMVLLRAQPNLLRRVVFGPRCYLVPRSDGRVLVGSTFERVGFDKRVTASAVRDLLSAAVELAPGLGQAEVVASWAGLRPVRAGGPFLAWLEGGLFAAVGHGRDGVLLAPATAEHVAERLLGEQPTIHT